MANKKVDTSSSCCWYIQGFMCRFTFRTLLAKKTPFRRDLKVNKDKEFYTILKLECKQRNKNGDVISMRRTKNLLKFQ